MASSDWSTLLVATITRELSLESGNHQIRRRAEEALKRELAYCSHLSKTCQGSQASVYRGTANVSISGISAIMIQLVKRDNTNLARILYSFILKNPAPQVLKVLVRLSQLDKSLTQWNDEPYTSCRCG